MENRAAVARRALSLGFRRGIEGVAWLMKILIPASLATTLLEWSGALGLLDFLLRPVMGLIGLPAAAALPIVIGGIGGIYAGIASMMALPFTLGQMTLLSIFLLCCHNLVQEGVIQGRSGIHWLKATLYRAGAAVVAVFMASLFIDGSGSIAAAGVAAGRPLLDALSAWGLSLLHLFVRILVITVTVIMLLELCKAMGWLTHIVRVFAPILRALGLREQVGVLWITAALFGLAYGAAVIVEEARSGRLSRDDLEALHVSIGINHSVIEDPVVFMSLGLPAFWIFVPRLIVAVAAVHVLRLSRRLPWAHQSDGRAPFTGA